MSHMYTCGRNESTAMIDHLLLRSSQLIIQFNSHWKLLTCILPSSQVPSSIISLVFMAPFHSILQMDTVHRLCLGSPCAPNASPICFQTCHAFLFNKFYVFFLLNNIHIIDSLTSKSFHALQWIFPKYF